MCAGGCAWRGSTRSLVSSRHLNSSPCRAACCCRPRRVSSPVDLELEPEPCWCGHDVFDRRQSKPGERDAYASRFERTTLRHITPYTATLQKLATPPSILRHPQPTHPHFMYVFASHRISVWICLRRGNGNGLRRLQRLAPVRSFARSFVCFSVCALMLSVCSAFVLLPTLFLSPAARCFPSYDMYKCGCARGAYHGYVCDERCCHCHVTIYAH